MKRLSDETKEKLIKDWLWKSDGSGVLSYKVLVDEVTCKAEDERDKQWIKWGQGVCPHNEPSEDCFVPRGGCERCWNKLRRALKKEVSK